MLKYVQVLDCESQVRNLLITRSREYSLGDARAVNAFRDNECDTTEQMLQQC